MQEELVYRLVKIALEIGVVRQTDLPDMTIAVYRDVKHKTCECITFCYQIPLFTKGHLDWRVPDVFGPSVTSLRK